MPRVLIGGVGYRFQRDASWGLAASDALAECAWPDGITVEDLGYGAIYVAQDIAAARPDRLILMAGVQRGRTPGTLVCRQWTAPAVAPEEVQARIREAGAGVIDLDHLLVVAAHFGALPADVLLIELEPVAADGGDGLSAIAARRLDEALALARRAALDGSGTWDTATATREA
jgi:hydrogenase maturation protease